jgi:spore maturation protein CgeB
VGAESGSYYLDRKGQIIGRAKAYLRRQPAASFDEVFERFFQSPDVEFISGKAISSRHFEPIGTKTCQILLEGHYNGILKPGEHYISVKKDRSNLYEAVRSFKDEGYRQAMVDRTYDYVMSEHTYRHRVQTLLKTVMNSNARGCQNVEK